MVSLVRRGPDHDFRSTKTAWLLARVRVIIIIHLLGLAPAG
jgi:hypothetical protein